MSADQTIYPVGWELRELSDVATVIDCKHVTAQFVPDGFPVISIGELGGRFVDLENGPRTTHGYYTVLAEGARRPQAGDVIMTRNATIGRCSIVPETDVPFAMGQDVCLVRPKRGKLSSDFLKLVMGSLSFARQFESMMAGSTFKRLNVQQIKKLMILAPSLNEQERIAQMIVSVEAHAAALERLLAKKRDVKQGMMQELLTGRTRLPGFTDDWRHVILGDHVTYVRTVALSRDQLDQESPLRYLHYGDIHTRSSVLLDAATESMPRAASHLASRAGRLVPGDVVFADASEDLDGVGKSVEISAVPHEGVVPGLHTIAARFDKSVLADGFKAYIQFMPAFRAALLRLAAGTKVLATTRSYVSSIALTLPGTEEQHAIAKVLRDADAEVESLERRLESARAVKIGMMQELLTGRTRLPVKEEV